MICQGQLAQLLYFSSLLQDFCEMLKNSDVYFESMGFSVISMKDIRSILWKYFCSIYCKSIVVIIMSVCI